MLIKDALIEMEAGIQTNKDILLAMLAEQNKMDRDGKVFYVSCGTCKLKHDCEAQSDCGFIGCKNWV